MTDSSTERTEKNKAEQSANYDGSLCRNSLTEGLNSVSSVDKKFPLFREFSWLRCIFGLRLCRAKFSVICN